MTLPPLPRSYRCQLNVLTTCSSDVTDIAPCDPLSLCPPFPLVRHLSYSTAIGQTCLLCLSVIGQTYSACMPASGYMCAYCLQVMVFIFLDKQMLVVSSHKTQGPWNNNRMSLLKIHVPETLCAAPFFV